MKVRKSSILKVAIVSFLVFGFPSCQEDDCGDLGGPTYYDVKVTDYKVSRVEEFVNDPDICESYLDGNRLNSCYIPYRGGAVFAEDSLLISILPVVEQEMAFRERRPASGGFGFISAAYACDPVVLPRPSQEFEGLHISSNEDFNAEYPAGTNLVDLFSIHSEEKGVMSLNDLIQQSPDQFLLDEKTVLKFHESPESPGDHILTFKVTLSDTSFTFKTHTLKLK